MTAATTEESMKTEEQSFTNDGVDSVKKYLPSDIGTDYSFKRKLVWPNILGFIFLHLMALYGIFLFFTGAARSTKIWGIVVTMLSGQGITAGAHRLFAHRSYKATLALRLALVIFQTLSGQNCLYIWVRDHRQHHKYSDTDADPHNANRGFFFSHIGWLMSRKHPLVISKGKNVDMSDLEADPLVMFQKKYYKTLYVILAIIIPVGGPIYLWNESFINSLFLNYFLRYVIQLHLTWSVNSVAHLYGTKPVDKNLKPVQSGFVSFITMGEGWHNYHHVFPWDYRAAEYGSKFNHTSLIIDTLHQLGFAYDLREASYQMVENRVLKTGDGSHKFFRRSILGERNLYERTKEEGIMSVTTMEANVKTYQNNITNGKMNIDKHYSPSDIGTDYTFKRKLVWKNVIGFIFLHMLALYGLYLTFTQAHMLTGLWSILIAGISGEGITAGAHRLYSHKSYKATFSLKLLLIIFQTMAGQNCLYIWVRDHRQHHKYSDTDADPHNANRGFFFSHIGWLMSRKHPLVISKGKNIDMSDLEADPLVMFQKKHYKTLYIIFAIILPVAGPVFLWNETLKNSIFLSYFMRYVALLHITWSVNSIAHLFGTKPFDKNIVPVESNFVSFISFGEGWHNYHHAFPWDYRAGEFGSRFNHTTFVIDLFHQFGLAYDLKEASYKMIKNRASKMGDGSHLLFGELVHKNDERETVTEKLGEPGRIIEKGMRTRFVLAQG